MNITLCQNSMYVYMYFSIGNHWTIHLTIYCANRFHQDKLVSHTLLSKCLVLTLVWRVCLPSSNNSNSCYKDINLIPNCTSVVEKTKHLPKVFEGCSIQIIGQSPPGVWSHCLGSYTQKDTYYLGQSTNLMFWSLFYVVFIQFCSKTYLGPKFLKK